MSIGKMIAVAMAAASAILPMASLPSLADVNITESVVLDADADWRGQGVVNIAQGATLDLASRTNALPLVSGFASGANTLAFADGATISVRLGDGRFPGGKVISWEAGSAPGNVDTLKFMGVGGERKRHFAVKDDGLYAHFGFVLVIR